MADCVLVTGISGFLGGHVALALLGAGYTVRGSVRGLDRADQVRATLAAAGAETTRLEFVALDLLQDDGWAEAMAGCRYLQHVASPFTIVMPRDRMDLIRPAVEGTRRALEAALLADIERVVLTSSMAAVMYGHDRARTAPFTAEDWTNLEGRGVNAYVESKTRAERSAWQIMERAGRRGDLVSVNPAGIFGPLLDEDPGTSATLIGRLLDGSVPALPHIATMVVDVRDVAAVQLAAMTAPEAGGRRFPMGSEALWFRDIAAIVRAAAPERARKVPRFEAPTWLVRIIALFDADIRGNLGELDVVKWTESLDAKSLLGRPLRPVAEALAATARSLVERGIV